ncbi:MAG: beta-glucoside-specific PTS transporter subunit IIABC [Culicoidibacterales bacterium]
MANTYSTLAEQIVTYIGGSSNIQNATHCQTRLRFDLRDRNHVQKAKLEQIPEVIGVIDSAGQFQVVIGTHVSEVYRDLQPLLGTVDTDEIQTEKKNFFDMCLEYIATSFGPLIPAISGAGMIKALVALLTLFNIVSRESQTYYLINIMADAVFFFLPFLLANSAAQKLKCSPYLAMAIAGTLLHPNFQALVTTGDPVSLFGLPVGLVTYGASVIPILLIVIVQSYIEKFFTRITPNAVKIVFVPMATLLITGAVALVAVGPIGAYIGNILAAGFNGIQAVAPWAPTVIVGTFLPVMVMFGIHNSIAPLDVMQLTSVGYANVFGPGAIVSNIATGVAALVVSKKAQNEKEQQIATTAGITALMGITEPALYGVAVPKKYPLIASMIGGCAGGLYAGLNGVVRYATGSSGLPALPLYIGDDLLNVLHITIALVITAVVTVISTQILSIYFEKKQTKVMTEETVSVVSAGVYEVSSPIHGEMFPLSEVDDEVFASGMLGKGVAFEPNEGKIIAPFNGKVVSVFPTKHVVGLESDQGIELLIHVGVDTVKLEGKYFTSHVSIGDRVQVGQTLLEFEVEKIREAGYVTHTPVIVTNTQAYKEIVSAVQGIKAVTEPIMSIQF